MDPPVQRYRQVGVPLHPDDRPEFFELVLRDLAIEIGRPTPEVRGYVETRPDGSERTWRVVCTVRGRQTAPVCDDTDFEVLDRTWEEGFMRVMQHTIARLCEDYADRLQDTPFRYLGRRDDLGRLAFGDVHPQFGNYFSHLEYQLQHTQRMMDSARARFEFQKMDCWMHTRQAEVWKRKCKIAEKKSEEQRQTIKKLRKTIAEMTEHVQGLEDRVEELEEETAELLKEKELLGDSDADPYEMDLEDDDPSDHDEAVDGEPEAEPHLPSSPEEDPMEPDFASEDEGLVVVQEVE